MARDPQKIEASCLILAGGKGTRLTPDKPLLEIEGRPIIARTAEVVTSLFDEVVIVTNTPAKYEFLALPLVSDQRQGCGPLMGIYSGLRVVRHDAAFVCAGDMPFLDRELIRTQFQELNGFDIVVPCPWVRPEFLHAVYHKRCLPEIKETLDAGLYKIELLARRCNTLRLHGDWFERLGLSDRMERAFTNINTAGDYRRWRGPGQGDKEAAETAPPPPEDGSGRDPLRAVAPNVLRQIRGTLIAQETAYQSRLTEERLGSLWAHSSRVGRIAHHIAAAEGLAPEPALLAGLLHDTGKFVHGGYHEDDVPEERHAVEFVQCILAGTRHQEWIPLVSQAILTMYLADKATSDIGRAAYDADSLDKLGCMGVAQFFAKNALRRRFLDDELLLRASVELTYAFHAPQALKTGTGRSLAGERYQRTRRFYTELAAEWAQLGLGRFDIREEDIGGIICMLVFPHQCQCGGRIEQSSDISDALKCRSVVMRHRCLQCGAESEYSFCLPNIAGLPPKRGEG